MVLGAVAGIQRPKSSLELWFPGGDEAFGLWRPVPTSLLSVASNPASSGVVPLLKLLSMVASQSLMTLPVVAKCGLPKQLHSPALDLELQVCLGGALG